MKPSTLIELLRGHASERPRQRVYTFLHDGEEEGGSLDYAELDARARAVGALLQSLEPGGERALLVYPPGLDFIVAFFGCQYSGIVAVPVPPPRRNHSLGRLLSVIKNARPALALTTSQLLPVVERMCEESPGLREVRWLATDELPPGLSEEWREPEVGGRHLSFLQYTSGSTTTPKGVMVSHENLLHNSAELDAGWRHDAESVLVTWLPHFHDMGLIYGILQPVYKGFPAYQMPPAHFLQRPLRWLRAVSRYRGTHSAAPNFAYDLCARKAGPAERAELDLSSWRVALNGAEPVRKETLELFAETFAACGFRREAFCPGYGLAEATLKVTSSRVGESPLFCTFDADELARHKVVEVDARHPRGRTLVGCGGALLGTEVVIVDPDTLTRRAPDEVGEIWVAGKGIARGYWDCPDATEMTFKARPADACESEFLRTGDLGFSLRGELFITGRMKDLLIFGGQNHYPQDIEQTVEAAHPALRRNCCAAFAVEGDGAERLVIAAELERQYRPSPLPHGEDRAAGARAELGEVMKAIRRGVAEEHELQIHALLLLKPGTLPKTSSGKVRRGACREGYLKGTLEVWAS